MVSALVIEKGMLLEEDIVYSMKTGQCYVMNGLDINWEHLLKLVFLRISSFCLLGFSDVIMIGDHSFRSYRNKVATTKFIPWPIEIRFCEPSNATNQTETPPRLALLSSLHFPTVAMNSFCRSKLHALYFSCLVICHINLQHKVLVQSERKTIRWPSVA